MSVTAKFTCVEKEEVYGYYAPGFKIVMQNVFAAMPHDEDENTRFYNTTPFAKLEINCLNPKANIQMEKGKEYYITIEEA